MGTQETERTVLQSTARPEVPLGDPRLEIDEVEGVASGGSLALHVAVSEDCRVYRDERIRVVGFDERVVERAWGDWAFAAGWPIAGLALLVTAVASGSIGDDPDAAGGVAGLTGGMLAGGAPSLINLAVQHKRAGKRRFEREVRNTRVEERPCAEAQTPEELAVQFAPGVVFRASAAEDGWFDLPLHDRELLLPDPPDARRALDLAGVSVSAVVAGRQLPVEAGRLVESPALLDVDRRMEELRLERVDEVWQSWVASHQVELASLTLIASPLAARIAALATEYDDAMAGTTEVIERPTLDLLLEAHYTVIEDLTAYRDQLERLGPLPFTRLRELPAGLSSPAEVEPAISAHHERVRTLESAHGEVAAVEDPIGRPTGHADLTADPEDVRDLLVKADWLLVQAIDEDLLNAYNNTAREFIEASTQHTYASAAGDAVSAGIAAERAASAEALRAVLLPSVMAEAEAVSELVDGLLEAAAARLALCSPEQRESVISELTVSRYRSAFLLGAWVLNGEEEMSPQR